LCSPVSPLARKSATKALDPPANCESEIATR
jgi:hypothetical protein